MSFFWWERRTSDVLFSLYSIRESEDIFNSSETTGSIEVALLLIGNLTLPLNQEKVLRSPH